VFLIVMVHWWTEGLVFLIVMVDASFQDFFLLLLVKVGEVEKYAVTSRIDETI